MRRRCRTGDPGAISGPGYGGKERSMWLEKLSSGLSLSSAVFCSAANDDNSGTNTVVGVAAGVLIGNSVNGQSGAVVGTVLGAVTGASINGDGQGHGAQGGYAEPAHAGRHPHPKQAYYQPAVT